MVLEASGECHFTDLPICKMGHTLAYDSKQSRKCYLLTWRCKGHTEVNTCTQKYAVAGKQVEKTEYNFTHYNNFFYNFSV